VLSRPDELNTMSRDFWVELGEVLEEINKNQKCECGNVIDR